jgi:peptide/nickel transport system permease protein
MNFLPVILPTDALIFLLVAVCFASAWYIRRRPHLVLPWLRVAKNPTAMVCLFILSLFVLAGLLDSLHYRPALPDKGNSQTVYSPEVLSVLDKLAGRLRTDTEKTYSAPLATQLYTMESMESADGKVTRAYPRLKSGGAGLADPEREWVGDVVKRALIGALVGLGFCGLLLIGAKASPAVINIIAPSAAGNNSGWGKVGRAVFITFVILAAIGGAIFNLSSAYHVFGTDKVGQDVLYLALKSIRTGLVIGTVTTLVMLPFAVLLGVAAGYLRGWVDDVIQYIYTVLGSIPDVLLIAAAVLMMQVLIERNADWFATAAARADARLLALCVVLGATGWTELCRLLRGEAMKLREMEYIQAAQGFGVSSLRIMTRHILPNVMHIVLISVVMAFSKLVLAEAVLSYIGVGVDPTTASFGNMINNARLEMGREPVVWWPLASAFAFMLLLVLAANLFADAVRDAFDPRLNRTEAR